MTLTKSLLLVSIALGLAVHVEPFVVYDCYDQNATVTPLDLTTVEECKEPEKQYADPVLAPVQIIQRRDEDTVLGYRCLVTRSRLATRCGFDSLTYGQEWIDTEEQVYVSALECAEMYEKKHYEIDGKNIAIEVDRPVTRSYFSVGHGNVEGNGVCKTDTFKRGKKTYYGSFETTILHIIVEKVTGKMDSKTAMVTFDVGSERVRFSDSNLSGQDDEFGVFTWHIEHTNCTTDLSEVAMLYVQQFKNTASPTPIGDILMVHPENETYSSTDSSASPAVVGKAGVHAGLKLTGLTEVCGHTCYRTHVSGLVVCFLPSIHQPLVRVPFKPEFPQTEVARLTSTGFRFLDTRLLYARRHHDVHMALCKASREEKLDRLAQIRSGSTSSLTAEFGKGRRLHIAGSVAWVRKCTPVKARLASPNTCQHEIPVYLSNGTDWSNEISYVDPISFTTVPLPTNFTCDPNMPPMAKIQGTWYPLGVNSIHPHGTPVTLKADSYLKDTFPLDSMGMTLDDMGIYSPGQRASRRDYLAITDSRMAMQEDLAKRILQHDEEDRIVGVGSPVGRDDIFGLGGAITEYLFGGWYWFWANWQYISGFWLAAGMVKTAIDFMYKVNLGMEDKGCGWWVVKLFCDAAFTMMILPTRAAGAVRREMRAEENQKSYEASLPSNLRPDLDLV